MGRIRTIKPQFFESEGLSAVSLEAHMLAAGLLCCADDYGYFKAHPKLIKASVFPIRELTASIPELLRELQKISYIDLGTAADGRLYGRVVTFDLHQRVSHPTASKIKAFDIRWESSGSSPESSGTSPDDSARSPELFRPEGNKEGNKEKEKDSCTEPCGSLLKSSVFETVPLANGEDFGITDDWVAQWSSLYPGVDVPQQIRCAKGWLLSNPKDRKTRAGINKFINGWLTREQDKGGKHGIDKGNRGPTAVRTERNDAYWGNAAARH